MQEILLSMSILGRCSPPVRQALRQNRAVEGVWKGTRLWSGNQGSSPALPLITLSPWPSCSPALPCSHLESRDGKYSGDIHYVPDKGNAKKAWIQFSRKIGMKPHKGKA